MGSMCRAHRAQGCPRHRQLHERGRLYSEHTQRFRAQLPWCPGGAALFPSCDPV